MLSRVIVLRNVLVAALRDMEFFRIGTAWVQDRPGYFLPMKTVKHEVRARYGSIPQYCQLSNLTQKASILPFQNRHLY